MLKPDQFTPYENAIATLDTSRRELELISIAGLDPEDRNAINQLVHDVHQTLELMLGKLRVSRAPDEGRSGEPRQGTADVIRKLLSERGELVIGLREALELASGISAEIDWDRVNALSALADRISPNPDGTKTRSREANMDGELHVEGECCGEGTILGRTCTTCGARLHRQPIYGGIAELCERCPRDDSQWQARGTYQTDEMVGSEGAVGSFVAGLRRT